MRRVYQFGSMAHEEFEEFLRTFERPMLRLCYRLLGNMADAQDAAQETFLKAFRNFGAFDRSRAPSPWIYQIAVNTCRDRMRRRCGWSELSDGLASGASSPEFDAQRAEQRRMVMEGLGELGEKERMALVLRDLEGLETAEVARILGSSEETVRSQVSTARGKLRRYVEARMRG
ncbi:MAG: sigma-70 family RNA polymerase sigma factor [Bryobacteraceae bacterium]